MPIARRNLLFGVGTAAVATAALPHLTEAFLQAAATPASPGGENFILLSRNENPYGPFPSVQQAMQDALKRANRYPFEPDYDGLVERIARVHGASKDEVAVGMGSTELLRMAADTFTAPGKRLITADPTFEVVGIYGGWRGADVVRVPLTPAYAHDLEAMLRAAHANQNGGLIYICNPNNPTASITPASDLTAFVRSVPAGYVVLIDEAYHHFAVDTPGYAPSAPAANLIITRTFSKVFGLAGIRLGYGVAPVALLKQMEHSQLFNDMNIVAATCGSVALDDVSATQAAAHRIVADRTEFIRQCSNRKLHVLPSYANFAMLYTGKPAKQVREDFRKRDIDVARPFPPMLDYIRVSYGQPHEMQQFWSAWDQIFS
jgi:histidinol-phosphate aminotransferase